jgi:hypothetical protein
MRAHPQEELDRRGQQIAQLNAHNEDLLSTVDALQSEVLASNAESERASRELDAMRQEISGESLQREQALREARAELERTHTERDDWEAEAMAQRVRVDEARLTLEATYRELTGAKEASERNSAERDAESERANNLQAVLEDFQSGVLTCRALLRPCIWSDFTFFFSERSRITAGGERT